MIIKYGKRGDIFAGIMDGEDARKRAVLALYPEYADKWQPEHSVLWNWIHAVAEDNGVTHDDAKRTINKAYDPIFGGEDAADIGRFIFYIA